MSSGLLRFVQERRSMNQAHFYFYEEEKLTLKVNENHLSPEVQDEIILALQKGGKWRTLCKKYGKYVMNCLVQDGLIIYGDEPTGFSETPYLKLSQKAIECIMELTLKGGTDEETKGV